MHNCSLHFTETEKETENSHTVKLPSASLQNKTRAAPDVKSKTSIKDKVEKSDHGTPDETTIFKRTALEEKLIAFSRTTDECFSDSDSEAETQQKKGTSTDPGVSMVSDSAFSKHSEDSGVKGSICTSILNNSSSIAIVEKSSGTPESVITDASKTEDKNIKKEVVEKCETVKTEGNEVKFGSKSQVTKHEDVNEDHNVNKKESSCKQDEAILEPTQNTFSEEKSTDVVMSTNDDESCKADMETLKENADTKLDNKKFREPYKDTEPKEDTCNLHAMIEDLQKYGTGMDVEMKTKMENNKSEKVKKEKPKVEPPKLTDVNFFSADVSKQNKKKGSKREKGDANTVKKEETIEKDKNKLKKKLSESKLATTKEKSKIQRYKELKKLVKDSDKKVNTDPAKNSALISEEKSGSKKIEGTKETKQLDKDSKTKISAKTNSGKVSTCGKDGSPNKTKQSETSKGSALNKKDNSVSGSLKISTSKSDKDRKTERNKEFEVEDSLKNTNVVTEAGKPVVTISSDSGSNEKQTKNPYVQESDVDNSMEDDSEENELLRIFNEYDPDNDEHDVMDSVDEYMMNIDTEDQSTTQTLPKSIAGLKRPSTETPSVGFKKQRVAHQPNLVSE